MAVDESNLETMIRSLKSIEATWYSRIADVQKCISLLEKIQLEENNAKPIDTDTGTVMSQTRRDEIYDACKPHAERLLGIE